MRCIPTVFTSIIFHGSFRRSVGNYFPRVNNRGLGRADENYYFIIIIIIIIIGGESATV